MYVFGAFELDEQLYELRSNGKPVKLTPRVYDLLAYLIRNRDRVVPKEELIEQVWQRKFVSESSLPTCVNLARKALGEAPDVDSMIQTVYGRGYRFTAPVVERSADAQAEAGRAGESPTPGDRPFVGRSRELRELRGAFDQVLKGRGRLVTLSGGPGLGKTRTAEEFADEARARGARILVGRCHEGEGPPIFWPWVQLIRSYLADHDPARLLYALGNSGAEIASLVPELRELVPGLPKLAQEQLSSESDRFRLFDALGRFLTRASSHEPLLLLLDDLHAADAPSLALLEFLARELGRARVLIIATYRDTALERGHPLSATLGELAREDLTHLIELQQLRETDVEEFLEAVSGGEVPAELVSLVYQKTEGNPLFLAEIVRLLDAERKLDHPREVRSWSVTIPQGVRETIRRRLVQLSDSTNRLLTLAAVCGRAFSRNTLEAVGELSGVELLEGLQEAVDARILNEARDPHVDYRFSHGLIREMIYDELSISDRAQLHLQVGTAVESLHETDLSPYLAELAHHFGQAAPLAGVENSIVYETRAGRRAATLMAFEDAAGHFDRALRALDSSELLDREQRFELLLELAAAELHAGRWAPAHETLQRASEHAREFGAADALARVALLYPAPSAPGVITDQRPDAVSVKLVEEALQTLDAQDSTLRALLLSRLALDLYWTSTQEHCLRVSQESLEMARRLGDPRVLASALVGRHGLLLGPPHLAERQPLAREALSCAERAGAPELSLSSRQALLHDFIEVCDPVGADVEIEAISELEQELKPRWSLGARTMRLASRGEYEKAEKSLREDRASTGGLDSPSPVGEIQLWNVLFSQGRLSELGTSIEKFVARYPEVPGWRAALAAIYFQSGREADARAEFERLLEVDVRKLPMNAAWFMSIGTISELAMNLGGREAAERLYTLLLPYSDRVLQVPPTAMYLQAASHYLGGLASVLGRFDDAERHFTKAIELNSRMQARGFLAYNRLHYARMLLARGRSGDHKKAQQLIEEVVSAAGELGLQPVIEVALGLKAEYGLD
ncbi:MAG: AAA family ATPase [Myxococcales bacterium]|nr:AAA family ATPase [Myxococcales bacterium]